MANKKTTELSELTDIQNDDWFYIIDKSDTTDSPEGTSKKIKKSNTIAFIKSNESLSLAQRKGDVLYGIIDQYTGEEITLSKVTGTPTVDNFIYFQLGSEYFKRVISNFVTPQWFGAKADGIFDDTIAVQKALQSGHSVYLKKGVYNINSIITLSGSNVTIYGEGIESVITSSTISDLIRLSTVNSIRFLDLKFETTANSGGIGDAYGIINSFHKPLENVTFTRCVFTAQNVATNAIKFINENNDGDFITKNVLFDDCIFENIGRMGIEIQNHALDTKVRYSEIKVQNCYFKNIGLIQFGMGISLSGYGSNCNIFNNVFSNCENGVELVGTSNSEIDSNRFIDFSRPSSRSLSFTGDRIMYQNKVLNNSSNGDTGDIRIWNNQDISLSNNSFSGEVMSLTFRDVSKLRAVNENYKTKGQYVVFMENASVKNQFVNCVFDNSLSTSNFSIFRTSSSSCVNNILQGCSFYKGTGGTIIDAINSAELVKKYYSDYLNLFYHDVTRNGIKYSLATNKTAGSTILNTVINIDLGITNAGWRPFIINVKVSSTKDNNTGNGFTNNIIWGNQRESSSITVRGNNVIGTATDLIVTTAVSGTKLVLTCSHSSIDALLMYWDVEVSSLNQPQIT